MRRRGVSWAKDAVGELMKNNKQKNLALEKKMEKEVRPVVIRMLVLSILIIISASFFFKGSKETTPVVVKTASVVASEAVKTADSKPAEKNFVEGPKTGMVQLSIGLDLSTLAKVPALSTNAGS